MLSSLTENVDPLPKQIHNFYGQSETKKRSKEK